MEKGGTSVLADAYMAKGRLTPSESFFAFGFGVLLQLIDDLQDVETDQAGGHATVFTHASAGGVLDGVTNRLFRFTDDMLSSRNVPASPRASTLGALMRHGCRGLILESIAMNERRYSAGYCAAMEPYAGVSFPFIRELHGEMRARERAMRKKVGAASPPMNGRNAAWTGGPGPLHPLPRTPRPEVPLPS